MIGYSREGGVEWIELPESESPKPSNLNARKFKIVYFKFTSKRLKFQFKSQTHNLMCLKILNLKSKTSNSQARGFKPAGRKRGEESAGDSVPLAFR